MKPKLGAGARGGHIIGTTKAGHPIYASSHAKYAAMHVRDSGDIGKDAQHVAAAFPLLGPADHAEAASAHFKQAYQADTAAGSSTPAGRKHLRASLAHNRLATSKTQKSMSSDRACTRCGRHISAGGRDV